MKPAVFYTIVVLLFLTSPYFIYNYYMFNQVMEDQAKVESGMIESNSSSLSYQMDEKDPMQQQQKDFTLQSYGYLGGALFTIVCPVLLLIFRHKFV